MNAKCEAHERNLKVKNDSCQDTEGCGSDKIRSSFVMCLCRSDCLPAQIDSTIFKFLSIFLS